MNNYAIFIRAVYILFVKKQHIQIRKCVRTIFKLCDFKNHLRLLVLNIICDEMCTHIKVHYGLYYNSWNDKSFFSAVMKIIKKHQSLNIVCIRVVIFNWVVKKKLSCSEIILYKTGSFKAGRWKTERVGKWGWVRI